MLHKWKTTAALHKHFRFPVRGRLNGESATLLDQMYADDLDFRYYSPIMAAAKYLIAYGVRFQDASLGRHLDSVFPKLLARGLLNPYQLELLMNYGDALSAELAQRAETVH